MKFWDSSALVSLLFEEKKSAAMHAIARTDSNLVVSFLTPIELESAIARRSAGREADVRRAAAERFAALERGWTIVDDHGEILELARRYTAIHGLRSGDAIQLASAAVLCRHDSQSLVIVTLDEELAAAARTEGHPVISE